METKANVTIKKQDGFYFMSAWIYLGDKPVYYFTNMINESDAIEKSKLFNISIQDK